MGLVKRLVSFVEDLTKGKILKEGVSSFHTYPGTPFTVEVTPISNGEGHWASSRIEVFREGVSLGGYTRNYPSFAVETFHPFKAIDTWYALYSTKYTATRVARLEEKFEDWCGEENSPTGFCPTEFFVPISYDSTYKFKLSTDEERDSTYTTFLDAETSVEEWFQEYEKPDVTRSESFSPFKWSSWGLVSGCVWGDDSSWKLRWVDLSKIPEKEIKITEKFGYFELPRDSTLRQSFRMCDTDSQITLIGQQHFDLTKKE